MAKAPGSKLRYDDFVAAVHPDPAKPEPTILLSGFVGRGQEGHARIYPDQSLGSWYDVPEGDIVHTLPRADAQQGGSYVWVKASAQIKPGTTAQAVPVPNPATQSPDNCGLTMFFSCICAQQIDARGMVPAAAPAPLQTHFLCTQGIATFCGCTPGFDCMAPPGGLQTHAPVCTQGLPTFCGCTPGLDCAGGGARAAAFAPTPSAVNRCGPQAAAMAPTPTPATHCFICPPPNLTQPVMCGVLPPSFGCTQYGCAGGALEARLPTLPLACATAATLCPHCTGMQTPDCPRVAGQPGGTLHTAATVCTQGFPTFCGCTPGFDCMAPPGGVQTHAPICTQGAPTFCGCTPGLDCAGGAARAAFQARTPITDPTPASHCFVCDPEPMARLAARTPIGHPTPATHCFVCDPEPLARQAMMGAAAPAAAAARWPTPATHCFICDPEPLARQAMMGAAAPAAAAARWPTPATHCFICPPHTQGWNCHAAAGAQAAFAPTPSAVGQCGPQAAAMMPTPATHCFICPPHTQSWNCYPEARVPTLTLACAPDPRLFTLGCASVVCQPLHPPTPQLERARTSWFDCYTREVCHTPPTPELQRFAPNSADELDGSAIPRWPAVRCTSASKASRECRSPLPQR